jgi:uncharacterized membrane protein YjjP (DUF1212 family)
VSENDWIQWSKYVVEGIKELKDEVEQLRKDIIKLKQSDTRWKVVVVGFMIAVISAIVKYMMLGQ